MSGGSYNYASLTEAHELQEHAYELGCIRDRLAGLGYAQDAAAETEELLVLLRQFEVRAGVRIKRLAQVWRAVEWWDSGDKGEDDVREALCAYRGEGSAPLA